MRLPVALVGVPWVVWYIFTANAGAYPQYSVNKDATYCRACHGDFLASSYSSSHDGQSWGDSLHNVHQDAVSGDCGTCHSSGPKFPVLLGSSSGGSGLSPISCTGCHGRTQDTDRGVGLRQHHATTSAASCVTASCHAGDVGAPVGEHMLPPYYANPGTGHPLIPTSACNSNGSEDFAGSAFGLDNDGDGVYDGVDSDCTASIDLLDFSAERSGEGVLLAWWTGSELDCAAFAILRCDRSLSDCSEVASHEELAGVSVPCEDDPAGAQYEVLDDTADDLTPYSYYLREYETTGGVRSYGPVVVDAVDEDDGPIPPADDPAMDDGSNPAGGCAVAARSGGGSAAAFAMLFVLGASFLRRKKGAARKPPADPIDPPEAAPAEPYEPPRLVVRDSDEFIRGLGPAQACSPTPWL